MYIKSSQQSQLLEAVANIMLQIMENYQTEVPNCKCKSICTQFDDSVCSHCSGNKPAEIYERRKHIFWSHNISQRKLFLQLHFIDITKVVKFYQVLPISVMETRQAVSWESKKKKKSWHYSASVAPRCFPRQTAQSDAKTAASILGLWRMRHEDWRPQGAPGMSDCHEKVDEKNMQLVKRSRPASDHQWRPDPRAEVSPDSPQIPRLRIFPKLCKLTAT